MAVNFKLKDIENGTIFKLGSRKFKKGNHRGPIKECTIEENGTCSSGYEPWNNGDSEGFNGISCYRKLGGMFQKSKKYWFPEDQIVQLEDE